MSKAFTRESDAESDDLPPVQRPKPPPGVTNYITPVGAQRFRDEMNHLLELKRQTLDALTQAAGPADPASGRLQSRIRHLQEILQSVVVANPPADRTRVAFGARVTLRHANGQESDYHIVGLDESDPDRDRISWLSPLARQLMNRRAGDRFRFRSPAGEEELEIIAVAYLLNSTISAESSGTSSASEP